MGFESGLYRQKRLWFRGLGHCRQAERLQCTPEARQLEDEERRSCCLIAISWKLLLLAAVVVAAAVAVVAAEGVLYVPSCSVPLWASRAVAAGTLKPGRLQMKSPLKASWKPRCPLRAD